MPSELPGTTKTRASATCAARTYENGPKYAASTRFAFIASTVAV